MEQLSLFIPQENQVAISCQNGSEYPALPMEYWMQSLVPSGEYFINVGEHPMVLRPVAISAESIQPGHHYYHFIIGSRVYSGIYIGREN